jgi:single-strand DNA-binding protein
MSNVFSFTGAIGRDAEVRSTPSGQTVISFTVANNIGFGDRQQTLWVRVSLWGRRAEGSLHNYLKKGQQVFVSGELSTREYQANDGTNRTSLELNATIVDLVGKRNDTVQNSTPQYNNGASSQAPSNGLGASQVDDEYDDVPF